jgi:GNAT superfamily N-acetyltransferase
VDGRARRRAGRRADRRGAHPPHVEPIERSEAYIELLISSRAHAGHGIGARLAAHAREIAVDRGVEVLRVDCWAGAPTLVAWYEGQGFARSDTFDVDGWKGQVFEMPLRVEGAGRRLGE